MPAMLSGSTAKFRHRYMREQLGEQAWEIALSRLTEDERIEIELSERGTRLATRTEGRLVDTLVTQHLPARDAAEAFLRKGGGMQADAMLDGMFRVFARFVSPDQALARGPAILEAAYNGIAVDVRTSGSTGVLTIEGLGDFPYVNVWICGWMEHAMERFGGAKARVDETAWRNGLKTSDRLEFVVGWE